MNQSTTCVLFFCKPTLLHFRTLMTAAAVPIDLHYVFSPASMRTPFFFPICLSSSLSTVPFYPPLSACHLAAALLLSSAALLLFLCASPVLCSPLRCPIYPDVPSAPSFCILLPFRRGLSLPLSGFLSLPLLSIHSRYRSPPPPSCHCPLLPSLSVYC
jgi:hypothetical protein